MFKTFAFYDGRHQWYKPSRRRIRRAATLKNSRTVVVIVTGVKYILFDRLFCFPNYLIPEADLVVSVVYQLCYSGTF